MLESFIERSFTPANSHRNNRYSGSSSSSQRPPSSFPGFPFHKQAYLNGTSPKSPRLSSPPERFSSADKNIYAKYLPPLYVNPGSDKEVEPNKPSVKVEQPIKESSRPATNNLIKKEMTPPIPDNIRSKSPDIDSQEKGKAEAQSKEHCDTVNDPRIKSENDSVDRISPDALALQEKYLRYNEPLREPIRSPPLEKPSQPTPPPVSPGRGSALASLQGLVYGKSFDPLSSLQKRISGHSTNQPVIANNSSRGASPHNIMSGTAPLSTSGLPSSLASVAASESSPVPNSSSQSLSPLFVLPLKTNPLGTLATNNNLSAPSSPQPQLKNEPSLSPASTHESTHSEPRSPVVASSENEIKAEVPLKELEKVTSANGDYRLPICRAPLIERIKERKTNSSTVSRLKSSHEGGKLKKAPYVYLPLDHSAKFNKYYEMANELASKTK